ncbi:MAG: hypothetical protein ACR2QI_03845 [Woeseiaceae bacterium]
MLSDAGYATGMIGKWHLGDTEGRFPTDQGFDEWYGIPNSSDRPFWPDSDSWKKGAHPDLEFTYVVSSNRKVLPGTGVLPTFLHKRMSMWVSSLMRSRR